MLRSPRLALAVGLASLLAGFAVAQSLQKAEDLYSHTQFQSSLALLDLSARDAATQFLIGRDYFMLGDFKKAVEHLQKAVEKAPGSSEYTDWLGRAYGRRAETANPLLAPSLASKARDAFEKAVVLDSRNSDALSDLFDYYLDAPGFLGGGYEKAAGVAEKLAAFDPVEGYFEKAKLAQKHKEFDTAEQHLRRAIATTPGKASALLEYARFLVQQGRTKESDTVLNQALVQNPDAPEVWYTKADLLIQQKRNLPEAKSLLQKYLQASLTPDDPSRSDAVKLLRQAEVGGA